ncbi:MAG: PTS transporter subunit EIIC [Anaerolineaceae bacterium]|nr:PTS transporter subunit EIIC [Anaerolineaceae bacterium]
MASNRQIAEDVLAAIGGKDNVTQITHCMTRLRVNLKDLSLTDEEKIKSVKGVLGVAKAGGQFQIVIGNHVDMVYKEVCEIGGFAAESAINENLDGPKEKFTMKRLGGQLLDFLAGSISPIIPALMVAVIFKMVVSVGGDMFGWIPVESDLYTLFTFVGDAPFYFIPVLLGYTSAKKLGSNPMVGAVLGAILIHPTLIGLAAEGAPFKVFGINASIQTYSSTILPILLSTFAMSYVEKFFKKILPQTLKIVFVPGLTILIMLPIALIILGPAGAILGNFLCTGLYSLGSLGGIAQILMIVIVAALWEFFVITGMHMVFITFLISGFAATGSEALITPAAVSASIAVAGMCLGSALRIQDKEERSLAYSYFIASLIGGITEPGLYGLGIKYKRPFIGMMIGGAAGGLYAALTHVTAYAIVPVASFLCLTSYFGGSTANIVNGMISAVIAFGVATITTYFWGFKADNTVVTVK